MGKYKQGHNAKIYPGRLNKNMEIKMDKKFKKMKIGDIEWLQYDLAGQRKSICHMMLRVPDGWVCYRVDNNDEALTAGTFIPEKG